MSLAHFAKQGLPVDRHAKIIHYSLDLFGEPCLQAQEMNILYSSGTVAWSDQRVGCLTWLEANPAYMLIFIFH